MKVSTALIILIIAWTTALPGHAAGSGSQLYRWIDSEGRVHYSDQVPPEYADKEQAILNKQGMQVDVIEAPKTPEQLTAEQERARIDAEKKRIRDEAQQHDRMLLSTFSTEADLIKVRDAKIEALDAIIRATRGRNEMLNKNLIALRSVAADYERNGKPVPDKVYKDILNHKQQITQNEEYIAARQTEQETLRAQFEADLGRYRELKARQAEINRQLGRGK
jgi:DNA repair exonuclease SbcCD ATPase subunit